MNYEQEIIDMENFYSTATIEEAMAFFKLQSGKAFSVVKRTCRKATVTCNRILRVVFGISRFFQAKPCTALRLRRDLNWSKVLMNKARSENVHAIIHDIDDQIGMEETLVQAIEILIKK